MLRVGFLFEGGEAWLGGVNYLWNLLYAITQAPGRTIQPVLVAQPGAVLHGLDGIEGVEVARAPLPSSTRPLLRSVFRRIGGIDAGVAQVARDLELVAWSHSGSFGWRMPVATLPWIPDLQHRRLPGFFDFAERRVRDYVVMHQLLEGDRVIVSSAAAADDLRRYYGRLGARTAVLRFVSQPRLAADVIEPKRQLEERLQLPPRYFFLPNQFWRHKNHQVVIEAMTLAAARGTDLHVILTGKAEDYRAPGHYQALMAQVKDRGLERRFRHLGVVSYPELQALMRHSLAVINPSLFEGWSTTVEEARSLGKATVLSDIDVHREQSPPAARFFRAHDADALARTLTQLWSDGVEGDDERLAQARAALPGRTASFGLAYQQIVEAALAQRRGGK